MAIGVTEIFADLTSSVDISKAKSLGENQGASFEGIKPAGKFLIGDEQGKSWRKATNSTGSSNKAVLKRYRNASDITRRPRNVWLIDFFGMSENEASQYEEPYAFLLANVKPSREVNRDAFSKKFWWLHQRPRAEMRSAIKGRHRYIATPRHSKFRLFVWLEVSTLPDSALVAIVSESDYFFGILHSRLHESWALRMGTWLGKGNDPRYTPTSTFETFPFPWPPGQEPSESEDPLVAEIAHWARELNDWRGAWLNPPREGMYAGLGAAYDKMVKKRTLTNLYNGLVYYRETVKAGHFFDDAEFEKVTRKSVSRAEIQELDDIHTALDLAVLDAYGWSHDLNEEQILERLLALNLARAAAQEES